MSHPTKRRRIHEELGSSESPRLDAPIKARKAILGDVLADGFPYSKKLTGHSSCVNALAFSHGQTRWLASAGDDPHISLWDLHSDDLASPSYRLIGPRSNVFALSFSASDQWLYSGDTDNKIYQYDVASLDGSPDAISPVAVINHHDDSIRAISCSPVNDSEFLSAGEDGRVILHDARAARRRAQNVLQHDAELTGVQHHPALPHVFATSDARGQVCLRDARMAFGPRGQRRAQGVVHTYVTTVSRGTKFGRPEASSITFDHTGTRLAVTMLFHHPTIYALHDPFPVAVCSARTLPGGAPIPPGARTYANSCTIKHGSFSGPAFGDACYYGAGSDDFCAYVWAVPDIATLTARRAHVAADAWFDEQHQGAVGFSRGRLQERVVPVELPTPAARLTGHASIVNTALFHPGQLQLATAGIERHVVLHGPAPAPSTPARTDARVRALPASDPDYNRLFRQAIGLGREADEADDDSGAIALFDEIIRQEGDADLFALRAWSPGPDAEGDGASSEDSPSDADAEA